MASAPGFTSRVMTLPAPTTAPSPTLTGATNALFARRFLRDERIALVGEDVGGHGARRIEFRPTLGLARCRIATDRPVEKPRVAAPAPVIADAVGDVEFF